ncbi:MAG TPA: hypothetical protein VI895_01285 [Bdellovibrionota bacterium]|nr:hypothetical protein [Bdellovibrionota bacterium]
MSKRKLFSFSLVILCAVLTACGGDDTSGAAGTYQGAIAFDSGQDGSIQINVPADAGRLNVRAQGSGGTNITGECIYPGGTVPLEGTLTSSNGAFTLSGGGFTFTGTLNLDDGTFTGSLTQDGVDAGTFSGVDSSVDDVLVFCGTFQSEDSGVFLVVVSGNSVTGSYQGDFEGGNLTGTRDGDTFTVQSTEGGSASGTISGNSITGTIFDENGIENGSIQGSTDGCST